MMSAKLLSIFLAYDYGRVSPGRKYKIDILWPNHQHLGAFAQRRYSELSSYDMLRMVHESSTFRARSTLDQTASFAAQGTGDPTLR
jgi:hypothetical protein